MHPLFSFKSGSMNNYFYYIVPGILGFFVVWVLLRFIVKQDDREKSLLLYLLLSILFTFLLIYGWLLKGDS